MARKMKQKRNLRRDRMFISKEEEKRGRRKTAGKKYHRKIKIGPFRI